MNQYIINQYMYIQDVRKIARNTSGSDSVSKKKL